MPLKIARNFPYGYMEIVDQVTRAINHFDPTYLGAATNVLALGYAGVGDQWAGAARPKWFKGVRKAIYATRGFVWWNDYKGLAAAKCDTCENYTSPAGLQIDHNVPWRQFLMAFTNGTLTNLEARVLYNAPQNLRLVCSICNGSHPEARSPAQNTRGQYNLYALNKIRALVGDADPDLLD